MPLDPLKPSTSNAFITSRLPLVFAVVATVLAGFLDSVGYVQLSHLYVSFMSGNSTQFGMTLALEGWANAARAGYIIATFVLGSFLGTVAFDALRRPLLPLLGAEAALCSIAIILALDDFKTQALTVTALMMGVQNVLHQSVSGTDIGKGFITGSLFGVGQSLARGLRKTGEFTRAGIYALSWLSFLSGVVCGALSVAHLGITASLTVVLFCLLIMCLIASSLPQQASSI
jgi:uncharacterized membrane protein YoaK (UPF0700 family)